MKSTSDLHVGVHAILWSHGILQVVHSKEPHYVAMLHLWHLVSIK